MILCIFDNCGTTRPETKPRECRTPLHRPWKAAELGVRHDRRTIQTSKVEPPEFAERTARTDTAVKHGLIKTQFADNGTLRGRLETDEFMEILDVQHRISTRETVGQTETPLFARSVSPVAVDRQHETGMLRRLTAERNRTPRRETVRERIEEYRRQQYDELLPVHFPSDFGGKNSTKTNTQFTPEK